MKKSSMSPLYHSSSAKASAKQEEEKQTGSTMAKGVGEPMKLGRETPPKKFEREASIDINQSAEAFISKFKKQLLIQRLESIENYEQMLARGT